MQNTSDQVILVDANNLGFAALLGSKERLSAGQLDTTGVYGFLRSLQIIRRDFGGEMILLWDGKSWRYEAALRQAVLYKGEREATEEQVSNRDLWRQSRVLLAPILKALGVKQMVAANLEADDLAARLRRALKPRKTLLVSGDYDWLGLVDETTSVWQHTKKLMIDWLNFEEKTGFRSPRMVVEAKAMTGDKSDNIPGVGGVGIKTAQEILNEFGTVQNFVNACLTEPETRKRISSRAAKMLDVELLDRFNANLKLIDLDHPEAPKAEGLTTVHGPLDSQAFQQRCEELAFFSITRSLDVWLAPFRAPV